MAESALLLLPTPHLVERREGWLAVPAGPAEAWVAFRDDQTLPAQGYVLEIAADGCRIATPDAAGKRHALATLDQVLAQAHDGCIPCLLIRDQPLFPLRGVMLDVSRDRIPTMTEFARIIPQLAAWKFNHLQLYVEHTVAYAGHEAVWRGLDPLTPDELRALDGLCAAHGIELAANQNCFGHLSGFLAKPGYQHLAEIAPDGTWDFNGLVTRRGPFSLCPGEPAALEFVAGLLAQLCPLIRSPWVNIGCDETFDVGQGRSRAAVAERGRAAVYLDFLRAVCALVERQGKRPQFWADIALEHPEALGELPPGVLGLAWGYEPDARFDRWCDQLRGVGREAWVSPGTASWRSITGRTAERRGNLLAAAGARAHGASGFLVTDWGDLGHRQQWPVALHGLAEAAHRSWSGDAPWDPRAAGLHAFGNAELGPWLDDLGDVDRHLRRVGGLVGGKLPADGQPRVLRNGTALFTELHLDTPYISDAATWADLDSALGDLERRRPAAGTPTGAQLDRELAHSVAVARFACDRAVARRGGARADPARLRGLIDEHRDLWLARSRAGGLGASCAHYERILETLP